MKKKKKKKGGGASGAGPAKRKPAGATGSLQSILDKAIAEHQAGNTELAEQGYRSILRVAPTHIDALHLLGQIHYERRDLQRAEELVRKAIVLKPDFAMAYNSLGLIAEAQGKIDVVFNSLSKAIALDANYVFARQNLGLFLIRNRRFAEAIPGLQELAALCPDNPLAWGLMGEAFFEVGENEKAEQSWLRAIELNPGEKLNHYNLGFLYQHLGHYKAALRKFDDALAIDPRYRDAHNERALVLGSLLEPCESLDSFRRASEAEPSSTSQYSNYLFCLSYGGFAEPHQMLEAHREYERRFGPPVEEIINPASREIQVNEPLRVGFVSADFKEHACGSFAKPLFKNLDPAQVLVYAYSNVKTPDFETDNIKAHTHLWREIRHLDSKAAAELIASDQLDLLVDLSGHTAGNRLDIFARKPAPVQATYLGYYTTTGLSTMDYWIVDEQVCPQDSAEITTEKLYRLPRSWVAYGVDESLPEPAEPPSQANGFVTFGSMNNLLKLTPQAISLFSDALKQVPDSRMLLKSPKLICPDCIEAVKNAFQKYGDIPPERLILKGNTHDFTAHMQVFNEIDIALDPLPLTGGTTTCDTLWMGVPVLGLVGKRFIERMSASMLYSVGMSDWLCQTREEFLEKAARYAADFPMRSELRKQTRQKMRESSLADPVGLAKALQEAFKDMVQKP